MMRIVAAALFAAACAVPLKAGAAGNCDLRLVSQRLESNDLAGAREAIDACREADPRNPMLRLFEARIAFYSGRYHEAVELLPVGAEAPLGTTDSDFRALARATEAAAADLSPNRSGHFILYCSERKDWVLVRGALETLEAAYRRFEGIFGVAPREPVRVEIYPDADSFRNVSSLTARDIETSGAVGICKFNKIMMISPRALTYGYRWMDTLTHEYIHYLLMSLTRNRAPIWVQEGVAEYFEREWREGTPYRPGPVGSTLLAEALESGKFIPFESMDPSLVKLETPRDVALAFAECATAVDFILARSGREGLRSFLEGIRSREDRRAGEVIRERLGLDFAAFQEEWKAHLTAMKLEKVEHVRVEGMKLAGSLGEEESLMADISSEAAAGYLRLGERLRQAGRLKPALAEYRRASRESPGSPYILGRAASAAALLGDFTAALEFLERAREVSPDYPQIFLLRGDTLGMQGDWAGAAASYDRYNEINPFNPRVYLQKGAALMSMGKREEAEAAWEIALKLSPDDDRLREEMESVRRKTNRPGG